MKKHQNAQSAMRTMGGGIPTCDLVIFNNPGKIKN